MNQFNQMLVSTLLVAIISLHVQSVESILGQGSSLFPTRGSRNNYHPLFRSPLRFVGKRDATYSTADLFADVDDIEETKRSLSATTESKPVRIEQVVHALQLLEMEQDKDFRLLLEQHRNELKELFKLFPPSIDRRMVSAFLNSLIKRRFNTWSGIRASSKRPSFNAWGGKRKRSDQDTETEQLEPSKRVTETIDAYTFNANGDVVEDDKRPSFNAWGGKRDVKLSFERNEPSRFEDAVDTNAETEGKMLYNQLLHINSEYDDTSENSNADVDRLQRIENENKLKNKRGFNAWGGKRASFQAWGGKRGGYTPPAGKRASFNAWGGKRSGTGTFEKEMNGSGEELSPAPRKWTSPLINIEYDSFYPRV